jgi:pimeloyl-ACP methyl ester carboxylesterase
LRLRPLGPPPGFVEALGALQDENAWAAVRAQLFAMWTTGVDDPAVHDYVASMGQYGYRMWSRAGREIARSFETQQTPLAALSRLADEQRVACPTLHLYAQPSGDDYLAAQRAFAVEHPWFQVHRVAATSHFPPIEAPEEVALHIRRFIDTLP